MYYDYRRRSTISPLVFIVPLFLILGLGAVQMLRGLPAVSATTTFPSTSIIGEPHQLPLPSTGASMIAVDGLGVLGMQNPDARRPIASVTKMMTAYVILKNHPLQPGETGPTFTMTAANGARYLQMLNEDQSTLPVTAGMQLTQLEMLQGLLIASANNFAEILAAWDAGTQQAFVTRMNEEARALGMTNTTYADASGFLAASTSTAQDQLTLARAAMRNPVFAQTVAMSQVRLTGIGIVPAVNQLLGQEGVVGIKTGFTEEAGGNLAFAAKRQANGQQVDIIGIVMGQPTRPLAFEATRRLLQSLGQGLQPARVVSAGQPVGTIRSEWGGGDVEVVVGEDAQMLLWPGMTLETTVEYDAIQAPRAAGDQVGWLNLKLGEQERRVPLTLAEDLRKAGLIWRLTRI
ncbi:MAG: hypothetical protein GEU75_05185 [Dehalococcoidia bacterium]|nr:hypothetical protein [Dehalococcoidia bacterium]